MQVWTDPWWEEMMAPGSSESSSTDSWRHSRLRGAMRHWVRHRDARTCVCSHPWWREGRWSPKDVVREIADAVHRRFYWFLRSRGRGRFWPRSRVQDLHPATVLTEPHLCTYQSERKKWQKHTCRTFKINSQDLEEKRHKHICRRFKMNSQDLAMNY